MAFEEENGDSEKKSEKRVPSDVKEGARVNGVAQDSGTLFKLRRVETSITVVPPQLSPRGQTQATYPPPSNLFFSYHFPISLTFFSYPFVLCEKARFLFVRMLRIKNLFR